MSSISNEQVAGYDARVIADSTTAPAGPVAPSAPSATHPSTTLDDKRRHALRAIELAAGPTGRLAVAFSGGVDSSLLLALACEALGPERVLAVTARSESLASDELAACRRVADALGVRLLLLATRELERAGYRENGPDRCYHCKSELFDRIDHEVLEAEGITAVAYGATADDVGDHRPGMRAAREHGVVAPLLEAGLTKAEIRALSAALRLETWDKPAQPCLASRIPYGEPVTPMKLRRIEQAEAILRGLGFTELRVRHHGGDDDAMARIEVPLADLSMLLADDTREAVQRGLRALGFRYVVVDLEGFRPGRLNEALRRLPRAGRDDGEGGSS